MEITFQNRREDFEAFYDYIIRQTPEGKRLSQGLLWTWLKDVTLFALAYFLLVYVTGGSGAVPVLVAAGIFLLGLGTTLLRTRFKPRYGLAMAAYRNEEKYLSARDIEYLPLKRTIMTSDGWLEVTSSEASHRWRWRRVDRVSITKDFIFIHVGHCPVIYVPRRDFPSEEAFVEFGDRLVELREAKKDEPIGAE